MNEEKVLFAVNADQLDNDVRSLLMAFFPGHVVERSEDFNPQPTSFPFTAVMLFDNRVQVRLTTAEKTVEKEGPVADPSDRKNVRTITKQLVYRMLEEATGVSLPWGTLTGIRPTKIARQMLDAGESEDSAVSYMENVMLASPEKTALSLAIAKKEQRLMRGLADGYSIYLGIPFCPTTCAYCSFTSYPIHRYEKRVDEYLDCLEKEIAFTRECFADRPLSSIYIGGGTPTTLNPDQMERLLSMLESAFDLSSLLEWTVEGGRPDSITKEGLEVLHRHPVDRISINPQTMKEETLKLIGRRHTVQQTIDAFHLARECGFDNINMDMIVGLPDESEEDVERTLDAIQALGPDSLTVHSLAIKRTARLHLQAEDFAGTKSVNSTRLMDTCEKRAADMGLFPYYLYRQKNMTGNLENVGYAAPGKEGRYNILIMEEIQPIVAMGAGAVTKGVWGNRIERCENVKNIEEYLARIDEMIERKKRLFADGTR